MTLKVRSFCRICSSCCPIQVTVENGKAVRVTGDRDAPIYGGYTCPKGRALPEQHYGPARLLHSLKRHPDGEYRRIESGQAMDEIAAKLQDVIGKYGARSVALYWGTGVLGFWPIISIASAWLTAIGSPMNFSSGSIDKPGALIAQAAHGLWQAGHPPFEEADCWVLIGVNPVISKSGGFPPDNPATRLKDAVNERGLKLIVIDPRKTESADRAHIHLQIKPGEDPTVLAGVLNVIIADGKYDRAFIAEHVSNFDVLARHVKRFTPDYVATRAGVPAKSVIEAARVIGNARYAGLGCGVGPSFALHGSLSEYLATCVTTIRGFWSRAGDKVSKPNVLLPAYVPKAQAWPPFVGWGTGEMLRVRGLGWSASGMPTGALADEILLEGEGQIKALVTVCGNPLMAWPDQTRALKALQSLELLVTCDTEMTATARNAHYVIAPRLSLETPGTTVLLESMKYYGHLRGIEWPYAQYTPKVVDPPADSDVIADWEFFYELAQRMGVQLRLIDRFGLGPQIEAPPHEIVLDMRNKPSADEILAAFHVTSRVPLSEVKAHEGAHLFTEIEEFVQPRDPGHNARLDVGNPTMMAELDDVLRDLPNGAAPTEKYPFLLISHRTNNMMNSYGRNTASLVRSKPYNPAHIHPADLDRLKLKAGDLVQVESEYGAVVAILEPDDSVRRGVISIAHCFGKNPDELEDPRRDGCNTGRLLSADAEFDPITGIPRMGALRVAVRGLPSTAPASA